MSKGFVWLALLADGAWKVLCKGQRRWIANTEKSLALVLSRFKTKLSVALIFVITRSALHFKKNFVIVSYWLIVFKSFWIVSWQKLYKKNWTTTGARVSGKVHMPTKWRWWQQSVLNGMSFFLSVPIRDRSKCVMWPGTLENTRWNFPVVHNVVLLIQGMTKKEKKKRKQSLFFMESSITSKQKKNVYD